MRILLQRVRSAQVKVSEEIVGKIDQGILLFVGFGPEDDFTQLKPAADKLLQLRIFPNQEGKPHYSVLEINGGVLAVSQFTLYADTSRGRRPGFSGALHPGRAEPLFCQFLQVLREAGAPVVESGQFGAEMLVSLENDGPLTLWFEF